MKKNIMLVLLTIVLVPATFQVAAVVRDTVSNTAYVADRTVDNTADVVTRRSACGPRCARVSRCPICPVRKPCCPKKVKVCKPACPRVSKCLSCEERLAIAERDAARVDYEREPARVDFEEEDDLMVPEFNIE